MMELEAQQEIDSEVRALGAQIVVLTPELDRYTRNVHKKLNLTFHPSPAVQRDRTSDHNPSDFNRPCTDARMLASSSMTNTVGLCASTIRRPLVNAREC
jgi:hypothetical protein